MATTVGSLFPLAPVDQVTRDLDDLTHDEWGVLLDRLGEFNAAVAGWHDRATEEWAARFTADGRRR